MGSTYRFPMRPSSTNQDKMVAALKESQARIASASNILIVGGGATGIEYAGVSADLLLPSSQATERPY
jgi:NADH dehydrogenase FAD-containing subunit